jgi:sugar lactone lactonase YvrE
MTQFLRVLLFIGILFLPLLTFGAEVGRFQHNLSVYADEKGVGLNHPEGIACNDKSVLVVGDTGNNRLLRFTFEDKSLKAGTEIKIPQLSNPIRLQMNSKGEIFALDGKQRRIVRLSPEGGFEGFVTPEGLEPSSPVVPRSLKIDRNDNIYVLDILSTRVIVLNPDGKFQRKVEFPKDYGFFSDLAVDMKGGIILIDSVGDRMYAAAKGSNSFSPLTNPLREYLSFPVSLTVDARGVLYVTDQNGAAVGVFAQDGAFLGRQLTMGWTEGLLYYPSQACVNEKGEFFIADGGNSRVQIFTLVK